MKWRPKTRWQDSEILTLIAVVIFVIPIMFSVLFRNWRLMEWLTLWPVQKNRE